MNKEYKQTAPTKQRSPPTIQATTLGSDWVLVVTWAWGLVKYMLTRKIWFCDNECPLSRLCKAFVGYSKWPISSHSHSLSFSLSFSPVSLNLSALIGLLKIWILDVDKRYQCLSTYKSLRENNTWQWGHVIVTGLYPKLGAATYWTLGETIVKEKLLPRGFDCFRPY